ncbi:thermonuclease family protein [Bartonella sp. B17]
MKEKIFQFYLNISKQKFFDFYVFLIITTLVFVTVYLKSTQTGSQKKDFIYQEFIKSNTSIKGNASVIDGDSIVIHSVIIRLIGIDAPELHQFCGDTRKQYPCGLEAKKYLKQLIANQLITCYWNKKDKYHRILATCKTKKIDNINAMMVRNGWAISYYNYPKEEQEARRKKKGIWQSNFQQPQKWRKTHPWKK